MPAPSFLTDVPYIGDGLNPSGSPDPGTAAQQSQQPKCTVRASARRQWQHSAGGTGVCSIPCVITAVVACATGTFCLWNWWRGRQRLRGQGAAPPNVEGQGVSRLAGWGMPPATVRLDVGHYS
jgi:hypothetical protein